MSAELLSALTTGDDVVLVALAEKLAPLIAERLADPGTVGVASALVDAATVARAIGKTRDYVYAHKVDLGGVAFGDGPRPRWGFDLAEVRRRLSARSVSERAVTAKAPAPAGSLPHRRRPRNGDVAALLPIRGDRRAA